MITNVVLLQNISRQLFYLIISVLTYRYHFMKKLLSFTSGLTIAALAALVFMSSCEDKNKKNPTPKPKYPMEANISYKVLSIGTEAKLTSVHYLGEKAEVEQKNYKIGTEIKAKRKIAKKGEKIHIRAKVDKPATVKLELKVNNNAAITKDFVIKDATKDEAKLEYTFN